MTLHDLGLDPFSTCVSVRRLGRCTRTPFFVSFRFRLLLASFLRSCLVGLLSLGCSPFSLSFSRWCAGTCVFRPVICFDLLCLSLCVGCFSVCVPSVFLWCCGFMLAWLRSPLSCPPPRLVWCVSCWSLPPGHSISRRSSLRQLITDTRHNTQKKQHKEERTKKHWIKTNPTATKKGQNRTKAKRRRTEKKCWSLPPGI